MAGRTSSIPDHVRLPDMIVRYLNVIYWCEPVHIRPDEFRNLERNTRTMAATNAAKTDTKTDAKPATKTETVPEAMDFSAEGWRPEPGDVLKGTVVDITSGSSEFGRYPIVVLSNKDSGQEVAVHAFHHTLKNRLIEMRPKVGHELTIRYFGEEVQTRKDGSEWLINGEPKTLHMYQVESPDFEFSWDSFM